MVELGQDIDCSAESTCRRGRSDSSDGVRGDRRTISERAAGARGRRAWQVRRVVERKEEETMGRDRVRFKPEVALSLCALAGGAGSTESARAGGALVARCPGSTAGGGWSRGDASLDLGPLSSVAGGGA